MSLLSVPEIKPIVLQKKQAVEVYQVAMDLLVQNTQHPFIAILLLAGELAAKGRNITPDNLKENLFDSLPERACLNLLNRIEKEKYLEKSAYSKDYFTLTAKGKDCIASKSIWVGEKGIYNIYITKSPFVTQRVLAVTRVESKEAQDDRKARLINSNDLNYLEHKTIQIISIDRERYTNEMYYINAIENKYFRLADESWELQYVAKPNAPIELRLQSAKNQYERSLPKDYAELRDEMLTHQFDFDYDSDENCISTAYDAARLDFVRTVVIKDFQLSGELFEPTEIHHVQYRPKSHADAQKWYQQVLKNRISKYYTDEAFEIESEYCKKAFQPYFNLPVLLRQDLIKTLNKTKSDFYLKAKLETIDFLNY